MHLTSQQVLTLEEESLREFLSLKVPEGPYVDYKQALSGKDEKDTKREFLKDVTAFANAAGGQLFIGVKEPKDGLSVEDQIVGLENGDTVARDLERVASACIDPRIPGLIIFPVPLNNGRWCVVVHIPSSLSRPHMVNYDKRGSFFVRHSESSPPMTTHEIREAVLTSASAEGRARLFVERRLGEVRDSIGSAKVFFLQAMPLIAPQSSWDVLSTPFEDVLRGGVRRGKFRYFADLATGYAPRPTIDGLLAEDKRDNPTWETEVHRTGYISLLYQNEVKTEFEGVERPIVTSGTCDLFRAFCHILKESLEVSGSDLPYLLACTYLNAQGTCLFVREFPKTFSNPCMKRDIVWPEHLRATGTDPMEIAESLCLRLFNAFGCRKIVK